MFTVSAAASCGMPAEEAPARYSARRCRSRGQRHFRLPITVSGFVTGRRIARFSALRGYRPAPTLDVDGISGALEVRQRRLQFYQLFRRYIMVFAGKHE